MKVNQNISAVISNARLHQTEGRLSASTEKLASGFKLNHAKDSPSGMAISNKMRAQINALNQSSSNAADGISVMQTADGALEETTSIIQRIRELAVQAASDTMGQGDREACQQEIDELLQEIDRIASDTEFNGKKILDGSQDRRIYSDAKGVSNFYSTTDVPKGEYEFQLLNPPQKAKVEVDVDEIIEYISDTIAEGKTPEITVNGALIDATTNKEQLYSNIRNMAELYGVTASKGTRDIAVSATGEIETKDTFVFEAMKAGSTEKLEICLGDRQIEIKEENKGRDAEIKIVSTSAGFAETATVYSKGEKVEITDLNGFKLSFAMDEIMQSNDIKDEKRTVDSFVLHATTTGAATDIETVVEPDTTTTPPTPGEYTFKLEEAFSEVGDTITIAGYKFTAVEASDTAPNATDGTFRLGTSKLDIDKHIQGKDIAKALEARLHRETGTGHIKVEYNEGIFTIKEHYDAAASENEVGNFEALNKGTTVTAAGAGQEAVYTITDEAGQKIDVVIEDNTSDDLEVEYAPGATANDPGTLTIKLAKDTSSKNTAEKIEEEIKKQSHTDVDFSQFKVEDGIITDGGVVKLDVTDMGQMNFQIGAHENQIVQAKLSAATTRAMYIDDLNVVRKGEPEKAMVALDEALAYISSLRGSIGAYQNRLEHAETSLDETSENMESAISRILDTDMAEEMSEYANLQVLDQAAISVLGQANDMPQNILQLLGQ